MKTIRFIAPAIVCSAMFVSANVFAAGEYRDRDQQNQTQVNERGGTYGHPYGSERPRDPDRRDTDRRDSDRQYPDRSGPAGTDGERDGMRDGYGTGGRGTGTGSGTGTTGGSGTTGSGTGTTTGGGSSGSGR